MLDQLSPHIEKWAGRRDLSIAGACKQTNIQFPAIYLVWGSANRTYVHKEARILICGPRGQGWEDSNSDSTQYLAKSFVLGRFGQFIYQMNNNVDGGLIR